MLVGQLTAIAVSFAALSMVVSLAYLRRKPRSWVKAVDFIWLPLVLVGMYASLYEISNLQAEKSVQTAFDVVRASTARLSSRHCVSRVNPWYKDSSKLVSCDDVREFSEKVSSIDIRQPVELKHVRAFSWEDLDVIVAVDSYNIAVRNLAGTSTGPWHQLFKALQDIGPFLLAMALGIRMSRAVIEYSDERLKEQGRDNEGSSGKGRKEGDEQGQGPVA